MNDFVTAARAETMLKDFNRLRRAVRGDNWPDAQAALDKCERWFDQISPNTIATIEALQARVAELEGLGDDMFAHIIDLMAESDGVSGLHQNGDLAPWYELTRGGQFEEWLSAVDDWGDIFPARAALSQEKEG